MVLGYAFLPLGMNLLHFSVVRLSNSEMGLTSMVSHINRSGYLEHDVAREILKFPCKTWEFRATSCSRHPDLFIYIHFLFKIMIKQYDVARIPLTYRNGLYPVTIEIRLTITPKILKETHFGA